MTNLETVQAIYAAFGTGDVPAILATLADDVEWEYGTATNDVPWLRPGRGHAAAARFLETVGTQLALTQFAVKELLTGPGVVVALVDIAATVRPTGKTFREVDEVHIWRFDERGRVARFRHSVDTYAHVQAARP